MNPYCVDLSAPSQPDHDDRLAVLDGNTVPYPFQQGFYWYKGKRYECSGTKYNKRTKNWYFEFVSGTKPHRKGFFWTQEDWKIHPMEFDRRNQNP